MHKQLYNVLYHFKNNHNYNTLWYLLICG